MLYGLCCNLSSLTRKSIFLTFGLFLTLLSSHAIAQDQVSVQVVQIDYPIYLSVGDYPPVPLKTTDKGKSVDISHMFAAGVNALRVRAFNPSSHVTGFSLQVLVNGNTQDAISISCHTDNSPCGSDADISPDQFNAGEGEDLTVKGDLFFDETYNISLTNSAERRAVQVEHSALTAGEEGHIYINGSYSGYSVADDKTFFLPQGNYRFAVGGFREDPITYDGFERQGDSVVPRTIQHKIYAGRYFEQSVQLSTDTTVDLTTTPPLSLQHELDILIVPVKNTVAYNKDQQFIGDFVLDESYIARFHNMMRAANDDYVEPLSYGLNRWNVSVYPVVTQPAIKHVDWAVDTGSFLQQANLRRLQDQYDVVLVIYNVGGLNAVYAGALGGYAFVQQPFYTGQPTIADNNGTPILTAGTSLETGERELPHEAAFHELLHIVEQWNSDRLSRWNGIDGLHGGGQHGYQSDRTGQTNVISDWMNFYVDFMQGRVAETNSMYKGFVPAMPTSCTGNCLYTGVFETVRTGLGNLHPLLVNGTYTIQNKYRSDRFVNHSAGVTQAAGSDGLPSLHWVIEQIDEPGQDIFYRLRPASSSTQYLKVDPTGPSLVLGDLIEGDTSGDWYTNGGGREFRLLNKSSGYYIHMENSDSALELSTEAQTPEVTGWWSSAWNFTAVTSSSSSSSASSSSSSSSTSSSSSSSSSSTSSSSSSTSSSSSSNSSSSGGQAGAHCNWWGTPTPLCQNTQSGWGWENNQSCVSTSACSAQPAPYGVVDGSSSSSSSSSGGVPAQCIWYGTSFPMCQNQDVGWGWENGRNCIGVHTCNNP